MGAISARCGFFFTFLVKLGAAAFRQPMPAAQTA
jgi:hypothetical protein